MQVDQHLRGTPVETVTLRQLGGTVDGCLVAVFGAPDLALGDRLLLFLTPLDGNGTTYVTSAGQRGLWQLGADGMLAMSTPWHSSPQIVPTADLAALVGRTLTSDVPDDQWMEHDPVPLDRAPLGDTSWPELAQPDDWTTFTDPQGRIAFDYPSDWTLLPDSGDGTIQLTSWPAEAVDEPVPDGALRIDIRSHPGSGWFNDLSSVPVTAGNQLATAYTEVSPPHEMYRSTVNYLYDGVVWEVQATYGTPPSSDDPAIRTLYTLLRSIRHQSP